MKKILLLTAAALFCVSLTPAFAESTDGSRSDSTFIRSPDHSKVPVGDHWTGDTATSRSGSRSDASGVAPDLSHKAPHKAPDGAFGHMQEGR